MVELGPGDFAAWFEAVHGKKPFPWQSRLLAQVAAEGQWPSLIDLPTGAGKTAVIDVAVFHLALAADKAPRRIALVVDRRTVVDQAFERAEKIEAALRNPRQVIVATVAARLTALSGGDNPLHVTELRGGMPRDDAWARRPDQPTVVVSTVDQVGSRLLFRGYGVSDVMRPIHAGLLGNDTLVLLDEVHLSQPFRETLTSLHNYRRWHGSALPDRFQFVEMSATPGVKVEEPFALDDDDRNDRDLADRLMARKPLEAHEIKVGGAEPVRRASFAEACAEHASRLVGPGRAVGVVVNRVATAREVFARVRAKIGSGARTFLVTGRMRPLDRDDLDAEIGPLVRSDRTREPAAPPVVVVSTQCIEAGADFDFDALVSECASLDAIRQRFGRLNRLGRIEDARGVVLARSDTIGKDPDPIYGEALRETWKWLGTVRDMGIEATRGTLPEVEALAMMLAPRARAPVMLPAHLDLWTQTNPPPRPDPDVALWLHGIDRKQAPEVQVVWRADISEALLGAAREREDVRRALRARVEACPPAGIEAMSLPVHAVRAWLRDEAGAEIADVTWTPGDEEADRPHGGRCALLWQRGEDTTIVDADTLRPGTTIVVPSAYGGLADRAWDPASRAPVPDLGDRARWRQAGRATLRLHGDVVDPSCRDFPEPVSADDAEVDDRKAVSDWLVQKSAEVTGEGWLAKALSVLARRTKVIVWHEPITIEREDGERTIEKGYLTVVARGAARDATTEGEGGSHTGVEVTLDEHMKGVARWAKGFAQRCGLPPGIVRDLEIAGRWHDAGKVDPRFQVMLHGGSAYKAETAAAPLAKSATVAADRTSRRRARERSRYPAGARHELSSVALLAAHAPLLAEANDRDLVLHLVASHHGWCRPFAPVADDREPVELLLDTGAGIVETSSNHGLARLDSGVAERFFALVERYGWYGLAWLEAILRLADHRRSEEEQEEEGT